MDYIILDFPLMAITNAFVILLEKTCYWKNKSDMAPMYFGKYV